MRKTPYKTYSIRMRERAVERMLLGESATRLAEEFGVHRTTLYGGNARWNDGARCGPPAKRGIAETRELKSWKKKLRASKVWWGGNGWNWIFSTVPCEEWRRNGSGTPPVATPHLRRDSQPRAIARRTND